MQGFHNNTRTKQPKSKNIKFSLKTFLIFLYIYIYIHLYLDFSENLSSENLKFGGKFNQAWKTTGLNFDEVVERRRVINVSLFVAEEKWLLKMTQTTGRGAVMEGRIDFETCYECTLRL